LSQFPETKRPEPEPIELQQKIVAVSSNRNVTDTKAAELFNTNRTYINQAVKMKETAQKIAPSQKAERETATKAAGAASNCNLLATSGSDQTSDTDKDMLWK
jgi:hypothetical protein